MRQTSKDPGPVPVDHVGQPLLAGQAALIGAVSGATMVGFGLLTSGLVLLATGRSATMFLDGTTWLWWPSLMWAETNDPTLLPMVAVGITAVAVGVIAGLLSRRRARPGVAVLVTLGLLGLWAGWSTDSELVDLMVPAFGTLAGVTSLRILSRAGRVNHAAQHSRSRPTSSAARDRVTLSRRAALVAGALLAVGAGVTGILTGASASGPTRRVASPPVPQGEPLLQGPVVNVRDLGAVGDGRADDADAIRRGLAAATAARGTLFFPAGTYLYRSPVTLRPGTGVTMSGVPGSSIIDFAPSESTEFLPCCALDAEDVTIDGLVLRRVADIPTVFLSLGAFQRLALTRIMLVGNMDVYPASYCHGIKLSDTATSSGLYMADSTITTTDYGLFQTNRSTAVTTDILIERCSFTGNRNSDVEFNSPNGTTRHARVQDSAFSDNDSPGFGVALAKAQDVVVRRNTFERYAMEAVHVEDYSSRVTIHDNQFTACGLRKHSHVQIIGGSRELQVVNNRFRAEMNTNEIYAVTAQPGGVGLTVSGRQTVPPSDVTLRDNVFECSDAVTPVYFEGTRGGSIIGSTISGSGIAGPEDAFHLHDSSGSVIRDNEINGLRY